MQQHLMNFEEMEWTIPIEGVRKKIFISGNQRITLVEFLGGFVEDHWCVKPHMGYMLKGEFHVNFNGQNETFFPGDVIMMHAGEEEKHMVIMPKDGYAQLILFEFINK